MKTLIVVDMQKDFIDGALGTAEAAAIVPKVRAKIDEAVREGWEIIFTRDTHAQDYLETAEGQMLPVVHCIRGTDGWQIPEGLDLPEREHIDKPTFGWQFWNYTACGSYQLPRKPFEQIELVGVCTDICVVSNALILKAMYPETPITVDASCCAGVTPQRHQAALETMRCCQISIVGE